jgi:tRNA (guanine10-N2)-dimethyltransferase
MALLIELSGEVLDLACHEARTTASMVSGEDVTIHSLDGRALVLDAPGVEGADLASRLGLAHHVSDQAVSGDLEDAIGMASALDIGQASSFRVRVHMAERSPTANGTRSMEAEVGRIIRERTGARVDLDDPEAEVRLFVNERAHAGLLGGSVDRKAMEGRAVKHRPFSHPVSIHPKFARAMLNVAGIPMGQWVMDPFCGTGGILIEAALLGYRPMGSDIDPRMVQGSLQNLEALGLQADVRVSDVGQAAEGMDVAPAAIVTDPPYGRSTSLHGGETGSVLEGLYRMSAACLPTGGRLVVCLPSRDMLPPDGGDFQVSSVHPMKVHRSLTRHVCVLIRGF